MNKGVTSSPFNSMLVENKCATSNKGRLFHNEFRAAVVGYCYALSVAIIN